MAQPGWQQAQFALSALPQQRFHFLPLPQGQLSLRLMRVARAIRTSLCVWRPCIAIVVAIASRRTSLLTSINFEIDRSQWPLVLTSSSCACRNAASLVGSGLESILA